MTFPATFTDEQKYRAEERVMIILEGSNLPITDTPPAEILARAIQDQVDKERCDVCDQRKCECKL